VGVGSLVLSERLPCPENLSGREAYVLNFYAESQARGSGVARTILVDLVDHAKRENIGRLWLHASPQGHGVYEAAGFEGRTLEEMELTLMT
jgi:GNAT superfamily N-acetyltransferase